MHPLLRFGLWLYHRYDQRRGDTSSLPIGAWGERWAARYLTLCGCKILARNARPGRHTELDLIAKCRKTYLFVEVKTRKDESFGPPITAITTHKRKLLRRGANLWLSHHHLLHDQTLYRFDAIQVVGTPNKGIPEIRWVKAIDMSATRAPEL